MFMTGLDLLVLLGYLPYTVRSLFTGAEFGQTYLKFWADWAILHQVLCLIGGFLWLAATVCYSRSSAGACLYCGRRDGPQGWQSPNQAARWGRTAVYVGIGRGGHRHRAEYLRPAAAAHVADHQARTGSDAPPVKTGGWRWIVPPETCYTGLLLQASDFIRWRFRPYLTLKRRILPDLK
jgi:hypothetical protein